MHGVITASPMRQRVSSGRALAILTAGITGLAVCSSTAYGKISEAHYTDGGGPSRHGLDITEAHVSYDSAGILDFTLRFSGPLRARARGGPQLDLIASTARRANRRGVCPAKLAVLRWPPTSSCPRPRSCRLSGEHDIWLTDGIFESKDGVRYQGFRYMQFRSGGFPGTRINPSFSRGRRILRGTVSDRNIAGHAYRCIEVYVGKYRERTHRVRLVPEGRLLKVTQRHGRSHGMKHLGHTEIRIEPHPAAWAKLRVRRNGKLIYTQRFSAGQESPIQKRFRWNCRRPATYTYVVRAKHPHGRLLTRLGKWRTPRRYCARIRGGERRR